MSDAQSMIVGLKAQECPGGGWNGMPAELEGRATVADCLAHGVCGCVYGGAAQHIERLRGDVLKYGLHLWDCPMNDVPFAKECTCGFAAYQQKSAVP